MRVSLPVLLLLSVSISLFAQPARAIDFTLLGGLNYAAPTERTSGADLHWTGDAGFSYGAAIAIPIFLLPFEFESGAFFLNENVSRQDVEVNATRKNKMLQIPFIVRFNFDEHIGLGVGAYVAFGQGNVETTTNGTTTTSTYAGALQSDTDSGLIANLRARFNLAPPFYFILDARYQHGFANRSLFSTDVYNTRSIQVFAGFQFALLSSHDDE